MGTGSFPGVESGRVVTLTPHPLIVPRSKKQSRAIPLLSLRAFVACKKGETYFSVKAERTLTVRTKLMIYVCIASNRTSIIIMYDMI
jgi:hypothetical protein